MIQIGTFEEPFGLENADLDSTAGILAGRADHDGRANWSVDPNERQRRSSCENPLLLALQRLEVGDECVRIFFR